MKRASKKKSCIGGVKPKPFALHRLISDAFPDKFDVRTIYHYTSSAVAQSLLNPKTAMLYCTWAKALNDEQEYKIGLEYALSHIAGVMNLDPEVLSEVKDVVALYEKDDYRIPWVMSFSGERDLLGQWRAYTNRIDGGYAVGFSFEKLESLFSEEKEYRLMIQLLDSKYEKNVEIVGGKPRLRIAQKVTSSDIQELISELWVSPHGDREVLRAVAHFLKVRFNPKLDVYYSNAPFNGR